VDIHFIEKKWSEYKLSGITNQNCVQDEINYIVVGELNEERCVRACMP
jgi:hypothetical protein